MTIIFIGYLIILEHLQLIHLISIIVVVYNFVLQPYTQTLGFFPGDLAFTSTVTVKKSQYLLVQVC